MAPHISSSQDISDAYDTLVEFMMNEISYFIAGHSMKDVPDHSIVIKSKMKLSDQIHNTYIGYLLKPDIYVRPSLPYAFQNAGIQLSVVDMVNEILSSYNKKIRLHDIDNNDKMMMNEKSSK